MTSITLAHDDMLPAVKDDQNEFSPPLLDGGVGYQEEAVPDDREPKRSRHRQVVGEPKWMVSTQSNQIVEWVETQVEDQCQIVEYMSDGEDTRVVGQGFSNDANAKFHFGNECWTLDLYKGVLRSPLTDGRCNVCSARLPKGLRRRHPFNDHTQRNDWNAQRLFEKLETLAHRTYETKHGVDAFLRDATPYINYVFAVVKGKRCMVVERRQKSGELEYLSRTANDTIQIYCDTFSIKMKYTENNEEGEPTPVNKRSKPFNVIKLWLGNTEARLEYDRKVFNPREYGMNGCASPTELNAYTGAAYYPTETLIATPVDTGIADSIRRAKSGQTPTSTWLKIKSRDTAGSRWERLPTHVVARIHRKVFSGRFDRKSEMKYKQDFEAEVVKKKVRSQRCTTFRSFRLYTPSRSIQNAVARRATTKPTPAMSTTDAMEQESTQRRDTAQLERMYAVRPFLDHIFSIWCGNARRAFPFIHKWLASNIQKPWFKIKVAIVLKSRPRAGKGVVMELLACILGEKYFSQPARMSDVTEKDFNEHLLGNCLLLFLDEAFWGGDRKAKGAFKKLITEKMVNIGQKYEVGYKAENCFNIILASNEKHAVNMDIDSGKVVVLECSNRYAGTTDNPDAKKRYMDRVRATSPQSLCNYLHSVDLTQWNTFDIPMTQGSANEVARSFNPEQKFVLNVLNDPTMLYVARIKSKTVFDNQSLDRTEVYRLYKESTKHPESAKALWSLMKKCVGATLPKTNVTSKEGKVTREVRLPSLTEARETFRTYVSIPDLRFEEYDEGD